jgi:hypothetical protein
MGKNSKIELISPLQTFFFHMGKKVISGDKRVLGWGENGYICLKIMFKGI